MKTRYQKLKQAMCRLQNKLTEMERLRNEEEEKLNKYTRRHKSLNYDGLNTSDVNKLTKIYAYFDSLYPVEWQGGLRCDSRGMKLFYWLNEDPDYLILYLTSTSSNICFSGSTSWLVKAETFEKKWKCCQGLKRIFRR